MESILMESLEKSVELCYVYGKPSKCCVGAKPSFTSPICQGLATKLYVRRPFWQRRILFQPSSETEMPFLKIEINRQQLEYMSYNNPIMLPTIPYSSTYKPW